MNAEEKAKELIQRYINVLSNYTMSKKTSF